MVLVLALMFVSPGRPLFAQETYGSPAYFQTSGPQSEALQIVDICCDDKGNVSWSVAQTELMTMRGRNTYWLKLVDIEPTKHLDFGTLVDEIILYAVDPATGKSLLMQMGGDQLAAAERTVIATHNAFKIPVTNSDKLVFVKITQDNDLLIRPRWVAPEEFAKRERDAMMVHSFINGSASIIAIFNLLLGLTLRKLLFVSYALFVLSLIVSNFVISGLGPAYVWPNAADATDLIREIAMVGNVLFFGLMIHLFLSVTKHKKTSFYGIALPAILAPVVGTLWWILPNWQAHFIIALYMMITTFILICVVLFLVYQKDSRAKILLPTLVFVIVPTTLALIVPKNSPLIWNVDLFSIRYLLPADHLFELVMIIDSLLFSLLFAFQIRMAESLSFKANQELVSLQSTVSRKIIDAVDRERRRIASDLHDTAGQGMLAVSSRLSQLLRKEKFTKKQQLELKRSSEYSRGIVGDIRRISHDLHPASIDHLGWRSAIEELFDQLANNTDIDCKLHINVPEESLSDFQKLHVYRITQEIITNIAKHSNATKCEAKYEKENDHLVAVFTENGQFESPETNKSKKMSLGHLIIDQRIQALAGEWNTHVSENHTEIKVRFPVDICEVGRRIPS